MTSFRPKDLHQISNVESTIVGVAPASGKIARAEETREQIDRIGDVPVFRITYGQVVDLPEPAEGTIYIVSSITAHACAGRNDVYVPGGSVRDADGKIIGCVGLAKI